MERPKKPKKFGSGNETVRPVPLTRSVYGICVYVLRMDGWALVPDIMPHFGMAYALA
jgi:hypothetical protein